MDGIRMAASAVCVTVIVTAILFLLLPGERYRGILQFAVSLFLLCGLIAPFANGDMRFSFVLPQTEVSDRTEATEQAVTAYIESMTEERIAALLGDGLTANGIGFARIAVSIHIEKDGSIHLEQVGVSGVEERLQEAASAYIRTQTGLTPHITGEKDGV